jgi:hypothetical protein
MVVSESFRFEGAVIAYEANDFVTLKLSGALNLHRRDRLLG